MVEGGCESGGEFLFGLLELYAGVVVLGLRVFLELAGGGLILA